MGVSLRKFRTIPGDSNMILKFTVILLAVLHAIEFQLDFMTGHMQCRNIMHCCLSRCSDHVGSSESDSP